VTATDKAIEHVHEINLDHAAVLVIRTFSSTDTAAEVVYEHAIKLIVGIGALPWVAASVKGIELAEFRGRRSAFETEGSQRLGLFGVAIDEVEEDAPDPTHPVGHLTLRRIGLVFPGFPGPLQESQIRARPFDLNSER